MEGFAGFEVLPVLRLLRVLKPLRRLRVLIVLRELHNLFKSRNPLLMKCVLQFCTLRMPIGLPVFKEVQK